MSLGMQTPFGFIYIISIDFIEYACDGQEEMPRETSASANMRVVPAIAPGRGPRS
jgi:hypothetical protein